MREFTVKRLEAGQRADKFIFKILPQAPGSLIFKMIRKKNIVLNNKKMTGKEILQENDSIKIYFSEDTFFKFSGVENKNVKAEKKADINKPFNKISLNVVYEDDDILVINKPAGVLSQKAEQKDYSANEMIIDYLIDTGYISTEDLNTFKPSICNRLDRNTSGLLIAGKSIKGLQNMAVALKDRSAKKYYRCLVAGKITKSAFIKGYLYKDEKNNTVIVSDSEMPDSKYIETAYEPIENYGDITLLEVHLITGRSHQIRAHLASIGHPIVGDMKYGSKKINDRFKKNFGVKRQLLHAYRIEFENGLKVTAPIPEDMKRCMGE